MTAPRAAALIDDLSRDDGRAATGAAWEVISDAVMGGVSSGTLTRETEQGRAPLRLQGEVRLDNNGGFVQMALDLAPGGGAVDASGWTGIALDVTGNGEAYALHLRTTAATRPWQSWRLGFTAPTTWQHLRLPFTDFAPHRIDAALDPARLRRVGLIAIGRAFQADLSLAGIGFYR
ncbi:MAG: hypothetical protein RLZZ413_3737 [Pseudomonadota bacterium]